MPDGATVDRFSDSLRGRLIRPEDRDYDEARAVWNGMVDRRPALIARCTGTADVILAVNFAREHNLLVSVKGGGHSVAGKSVCDDGLMIDLSEIKGVRVDPEARRARVGGGATLADLDHETQAFGLATPGGLVSHTGVAGLALGGGQGYLSRKYGLTADNLVAADVVTADGRVLHAGPREHADLLWGLRGGGGNFGVVTSFEFQLHPVGPEVMTAQVYYPIAAAAEILPFYRGFVAAAPDELTCYALWAKIPPVAPFPGEFHGRETLCLVACCAGSLDEGRALLAPLENLGNPILRVIQPMQYTALQKNFDEGVRHGNRYYWKSHQIDELSDELIDTIIRLTGSFPGEFSLGGLEPLGGAIGRVDPAATACFHRRAAFTLSMWSGWSNPADDAEIIASTRAFHEAVAPCATDGAYTNYLDGDEDGRVGTAFGENYQRLQRVKARYDPENFFRLNQNIEPPA